MFVLLNAHRKCIAQKIIPTSTATNAADFLCLVLQTLAFPFEDLVSPLISTFLNPMQELMQHCDALG